MNGENYAGHSKFMLWSFWGVDADSLPVHVGITKEEQQAARERVTRKRQVRLALRNAGVTDVEVR